MPAFTALILDPSNITSKNALIAIISHAIKNTSIFCITQTIDIEAKHII